MRDKQANGLKSKNNTADMLVLIIVLALILPTVASMIQLPEATASAPARIRLSFTNADTQTRMTVTWETDSTGNPATVEYGTTVALGSSVSGASRTLWRGDAAHTTEITGLNPGTEYFYRVSGDSGEWSSIYSFNTAPSGPADTSFFAGGDSRDNAAGWATCANSMASQPEVDLTLFNGDYEYEYSDPATMRTWFTNAEATTRIQPFLTQMGNHEEDYAAGDYLNYLDDFDLIGVNGDETDEHFYSFDWGLVHFISLNTEADERNYIPATVQAAQNAWLAADLAAADANRDNVPWIVVQAHQPMYAAGGSHGPPSGGNCVATWLPLFDTYNVNVYINGHNHMYQRSYPIEAGAATTTAVNYYPPSTTGTIYATIGKMGTSSTYTPSGSALFAPTENNQISYGRFDVLVSNGSMHYTLLDPYAGEAILDEFWWEIDYINSAGTIDIEKDLYAGEDTVQITVKDSDLNTNSGVAETVDVTLSSTTEPGGETVTLTEQGLDIGIFMGTGTISLTDGAGIVHVSDGDTITATYNDADDGSGSPAVVDDTALVDGASPAPPTTLSVEWYGQNSGASIYNYQGVTAAAGPHDIYECSATSISSPAGPVINIQTEASDAEYVLVDTSDDNRWASPDYGGSEHVFMLCDMQITEAASTVDQLEFSYEVFATRASDFYIWAQDNSANWYQVGGPISLGNNGEATITRTIGLSGDDLLMDPSGFVNAGIVSWGLWQTDVSDDLATDYAELTVAYSYTSTDDNTLNWTRSADDGAGADDVLRYNIYRADNAGGPWDTILDSVPAGTETYCDVGMGEFDGTNWWYVVRAEDIAGNEDTNSNAVPEQFLGNVAPFAPLTPTPSDGATINDPDPALSVSVTDPNGDPMDVHFYDASGPTLIGTDPGVISGGIATISWLGLSDGTYTWYAVADDGEFTTQSATWTFTVDTSVEPPTGLTVEWSIPFASTIFSDDVEGGDLGYLTSGGGAPITVTYRVTDDAEECIDPAPTAQYTGFVTTTSTDLEFDWDDWMGGAQQIGMRFTGVDVPQGATITSADLTFTCDEADKGVSPVDLTFFAEASDNPVAFAAGDFDLTNRADGAQTAAWTNVPSWTLANTYTTPDLSNVIQEVVDRPGWNPLNAMAIFATGNGQGGRVAEPAESGAAVSPLLSITYITSSFNIKANGANSPTQSWDLGNGDYPDPGAGGALHYLTSPDIDLTGESNAELSFWHWRDFEPGLVDGGNVKISTTGTGGPWISLDSPTPAYDGACVGTDNPLNGEQIWGNNDVWEQVTIDISAYAGNVVNVRWEAGVDNSGTTADAGWRIDDIQVTSLSGNHEHNVLNWTLSADDGAGADDVASYNIYRADNPGGPWDAAALWDTVTAGTDTYTDPGAGEFDGTTWWYVVRAKDSLGNEDTNTIAVPEPGAVPPSNFMIPVIAGWNFISTPLIPSDTSILTIMTDIDGDTTWSTIFYYDGSDVADHWKCYDKAQFAAGLSQDLSNIDVKMGVWVFVDVVGDGFIKVEGTDPVGTTINLVAGWNMVGFPSQVEGYTALDLKTDSGGLVTIIERFNDASAYNMELMPDGEMFIRGQAYWVYCTAAYSWVIP